MNCNVIKDLIPLYVDDCCSEESAKLVTEHMEACTACRKTYTLMKQSCTAKSAPKAQMGMKRISEWKASLIQSVMLFLSFAIITLGVVLEGKTPMGDANGLWALALIIPATGYLLSLANWFFVRVYKSRKIFSNASLVTTALFILGGYLWAFLHYAGAISIMSPLVIGGVALSLVFCVLSKLLSARYALLLGRE